MGLQREPVSIICVFNDPEVRRHCLDRSIERLRADSLEVDYVPVDNVDSAFSSAGAALNHGATLGRNDYFVFVHQDVYLHSIEALERAAGMLADDESIGLIGAIGITADGRLVGQIRDRVVLLGESAPAPVEVDSLDEVLFMTSRAILKAEPLTELPELAWHAYAVEYGLRIRGLGKRVVATNLAVTHNSLTINLDRLDAAHTRVGAAYPQALPVRTTCGTISSPTTGSDRSTFLRAHRWRYPWLKESLVAHRGRRAVRGGPFLLSDIRRDIDDALAGRTDPLRVVNLLDAQEAFPADEDELTLLRRGQPIEPSFVPRAQLPALLADWRPDRSLLVTNLQLADFPAVATAIGPERRLAGYHEGIGYWLLLGPVLNTPARQWYSVRATPAGMRRLAS
jgi:hypothetical protein